MTEMSDKTHCGLCARALSGSNQSGLGTECKSKLPETLTVALLNRSEHAHHDGGGLQQGQVSNDDIKNAFSHLGDTADLLIFVSGFTQGNFIFEEENASWEIWYKSKKGIHFIDATKQRAAFTLDGEYKGTMLDDEEMRKLVLLMCSKSTKTKVKLTWVDSELGYMMNRAHYNGPYPPGMDVEEWAREIHGVSHEKFQICWTCDQSVHRRETQGMHQDDIDQRVLQFEEFKDKYPELRHSLYRDFVEYQNSYDEEIIENIEGMFNDITKDEQNCSEYFIGGPMFYDPTDSHQYFWNYNSVQAGEIGWLTIYGNHIFVEYLLPYLLREAYALFNEDWTPREYLPQAWDKPDYAEWVNSLSMEGWHQTHVESGAEERAIYALRHTINAMYPHDLGTQCREKNCEYCDN